VSLSVNDNVSYIYDMARREWIGSSLYGFNGFSESPTDFYAVGGVGATGQGVHAHLLYSGSTDSNGDDIPVTCELPPFFGESPSRDKQFIWVDLLMNRQAVDSDMVVKAIIDSDASNAVSITVPMDESGNTQSRVRRKVNLGLRGRELTLQFTSTASSPQWKLYGAYPAWHEFRVSYGAA
jgi:hypothetical protein